MPSFDDQILKFRSSPLYFDSCHLYHWCHTQEIIAKPNATKFPLVFFKKFHRFRSKVYAFDPSQGNFCPQLQARARLHPLAWRQPVFQHHVSGLCLLPLESLGNRVRYFDFARGVFFCLDESLFSTWLNVSIFASTASGLCSVVPKAASSPPSQRDLPRVPSPLVVCFFFAQCEGRRPDSSQCPSTTHHPVYASSAIRDAVEACTQCPWASGSVSRSPFGAAAQASRDRTPSR